MKKAASQKARINSREDRIVRYSIYEFIASVHARPQLWDRQHSDYHNREKREQTWLEVAKRLHPKFDAMPAAEKQKTVVLLAKRWKNTRDSFFRAQRRSRSQKHQDESRAYIYERELRFLTRDSEEGAAPNTNNVSSQEESKPFRGPKEEKVKIEDEERTPATTSGRTGKKRRKATAAARSKRSRATILTAEPSASDDINETQPQQDSSSTDVNALAALMSVTTALKEELVENNPASTEDKSAAESDPDQSFFDSIKPVVRNMSMDQRLDFQIEVLKLLKDFRGKH